MRRPVRPHPSFFACAAQFTWRVGACARPCSTNAIPILNNMTKRPCCPTAAPTKPLTVTMPLQIRVQHSSCAQRIDSRQHVDSFPAFFLSFFHPGFASRALQPSRLPISVEVQSEGTSHSWFFEFVLLSLPRPNVL